MTQRGSGYNNPAFCNQFDTNLYDYEYVPEIDPDSPDLERKGSYRLPRQIPPPWDVQQPAFKIQNNQNSSSDDSNGSIIVEERNNRRVTLICEKRPKIVQNRDGSYVHDISLESTDSNNEDMEEINFRRSTRNNEGNVKSYKPSQNYVRNLYETDMNRPAVQRNQWATNHRYEDLSPLSHEEEMSDRRHRYAEIEEELETEGVHFTMRKPPVRSPPNSYNPHGSFPKSPQKFAQDFNNSFQEFIHTSSPIDGSFELSNFSPSRDFQNQRQPPVGASTVYAPEPMQILHSNSENFERSPSKKHLLTPKRKIIFTKSNVKARTEEKPKHSARRNISSSFINEQTCGSPYRPTTEAVTGRNTAVVTPTLQRKLGEFPHDTTNFQKVSRMFQSTGNVLKNSNERYQVQPLNNFNINPYQEQAQMKRNKSVPNFQQQNEKRTPSKDMKNLEQGNLKKFDYSTSPTKSPEKFSPLSKSRLSLLEKIKGSSTVLDAEEYPASPSGCLMIAAVVQLLAGMVTCGICFYLLSKLGRRYYLDLGTLAGFVSMVLGGLGFRSQRWKWLPNRNYVSGYVVLAGFSILNAASVSLIISIRPMSGDPVLDVLAGAICAISVIVIGVALTGLTLSGCCKTPPPDNRVAYA